MISVHNRLFLEPYKGERKIEASVKSGFATVKQRSTLIGLKLVAPAQVYNASNHIETLNKGTVVYFPESVLASEAWAKSTFTADTIDSEFIIADYAHAVSVING